MKKNPLIYEINSRNWIFRLRDRYGMGINLGNIPPAEIQHLRDLGVDYIWLMGVWATGERSRRVSRETASLEAAYEQALPGYQPEDIVGSPYAISDYTVSDTLGGEPALQQFRQRLSAHGIGLILDFIPNHMGLDHSWIKSNPEYFISADSGKARSHPDEFASNGSQALAHGKDPYFPAWTDTVQLNYFEPALRKAQTENLRRIARLCDGVRCDMAMLVTNEVFDRTWRVWLNGQPVPDTEFWSAAIAEVKSGYPDFLFIAEVYWDMEWQLQQMGFDFTYDKRLYDRLHGSDSEDIRGHLRAATDFQSHSLRFIENHDEQRAVIAFGRDKSLAAAAVMLTIPGGRMLHDGQTEGWRVKLPVQLRRMKREAGDGIVRSTYQQLLNLCLDPVMHEGSWSLMEIKNVLAWQWVWTCEVRRVLINYSDQPQEVTFRKQGAHVLDLMDKHDEIEVTNGLVRLPMRPWQVRILV
jgi:glycosidase